MFPYEQSDVTMLENGTHNGVITKVDIYSNPSGPDKLIVKISLEDGTLFSYFFTPGFPAFDELLKVAGETPKPKGEFDEQKLVNKMVSFETKITEAKNGNQYCNVVSISPFDIGDEVKKN